MTDKEAMGRLQQMYQARPAEESSEERVSAVLDELTIKSHDWTHGREDAIEAFAILLCLYDKAADEGEKEKVRQLVSENELKTVSALLNITRNPDIEVSVRKAAFKVMEHIIRKENGK